MELKVGVKIILQNYEGEYLMLLRSLAKYPNSGAQWEIVGGRIDPGTSLLENLKREVREETGLEIVGDVKLLDAQDILRPDKHTVRLTYVGRAQGEVRLSDEHTEYKWVELEMVRGCTPLDPYVKEVFEKFIF